MGSHSEAGVVVKSGARSHRLGAVLAALVAVAVLAGCTLPRPDGASPLRYRDQVFSAVTTTSNLQYGSAPLPSGETQALTLDLYRPTGDTQTKRPAIVWVHGGSFISGDKTNFVPVDVANTFAKQGYVVVSINYRLTAPSGCAANPSQSACTIAALDAQHDAQAAVRWLRNNATTYGIDPARIGIGGESAGGITATLVGLRPNDPGTSGNPGPSSKVRAFVSVSGRASRRRLRLVGRLSGTVLPRHGRSRGLPSVVEGHRRGAPIRGRLVVAPAAGGGRARALGAVPLALPRADGLLPLLLPRRGPRAGPAQLGRACGGGSGEQAEGEVPGARARALDEKGPPGPASSKAGRRRSNFTMHAIRRTCAGQASALAKPSTFGAIRSATAMIADTGRSITVNSSIRPSSPIRR